MEGTMGNEGINKLAGVLQNRIKTVTAKPAILDIGEIGGDMSLTTNQFPQPIPQTDYIVCRQLKLGKTGEKLTETKTQGQHSGHTGGDGSHDHDIKIPEKMRSIKPGDRVLVAWVGDDACIIDLILPGTAV